MVEMECVGIPAGNATVSRRLRKLLGHQSILTTQRYMAPASVERKAVEALFKDVAGK